MRSEEPMEYEEEGQVLNFISGMMLGLAIGAGAAMLMAPASGQKTRKRIRKATRNLAGDTTDRWEDLADDVRDRASQVRGRVDDAVHGARKRFR